MHLGNVRTALLAWLSVRAQKGTVILRVEDLDTARVAPEAGIRIIEDFSALGLDWDSGPEAEGRPGAFHQSTRLQLYEAALEVLSSRGLTYPCSCSRADIARAASAPHMSDEGPSYPGTCRTQDPDQVRAVAKLGGKRVSIRFRSDPQLRPFRDAVAGEVSLAADDFALWRADGVPAYQLAVVVDDALMGVTEVVRGADLLTSTPRQLALYQALGYRPPQFAHVPMVLAASGTPLAKRNRPAPVSELLARGVSPETIIGALAASAGLCPPGTRALPKHLIDSFAWSRVDRRPVVLDSQTLESHFDQ